jgi:hypothetical protein
LIALAKDKATRKSLAIFKPTEIIDFVVEETDREWDKRKRDLLHSAAQQFSFLQTPAEIDEAYRLVTKIPYKFSYKFREASGKVRKLMIEDWELGMLYLNCLKRANGDEAKAIEKVREKYLTKFVEKNDMYFFVGTTLSNHYKSKNPFIIIGVFYPPKGIEKRQISFLDN